VPFVLPNGPRLRCWPTASRLPRCTGRVLAIGGRAPSTAPAVRLTPAQVGRGVLGHRGRLAAAGTRADRSRSPPVRSGVIDRKERAPHPARRGAAPMPPLTTHPPVLGARTASSRDRVGEPKPDSPGRPGARRPKRLWTSPPSHAAPCSVTILDAARTVTSHPGPRFGATSPRLDAGVAGASWPQPSHSARSWLPA
jgi:hypothetical protein